MRSSIVHVSNELRISFSYLLSAPKIPKVLILVQAQNRDRAATDSAAMEEPWLEDERGNGPRPERRYCLILEDTLVPHGRLLNTAAVTVGELKEAVVQRLAYDDPPLIGSIDELLRISYAFRNPSTGEPQWVVCWDAEDEYEDGTTKLPDIPSDTNLYYAVADNREGSHSHHRDTMYQ